MSPSPSRKNRPASGIRRGFANVVFGCVATVLLLLLLLQGFLLFGGSIPIPEIALTRVQQELRKHGYRADAASIEFRLPNRAIVRDLQLIESPEAQAVASAELGQIRFSWQKLLRGNFALEEVALDGGALFSPPRLSPTGVRERLVAGVRAVVSPHSEAWKIQNLSAHVENVRVTASGSLPRLPKPEDKVERPDWEMLLEEWLPRIARERSALRLVEDPHVRLRFDRTSSPRGVAIKAEVWAGSVERSFEEIPEAEGTVKVIEPRLAGDWKFDGNRLERGSLSFRARSLGAEIRKPRDATVVAHKLTANVDWEAAGELANLLPVRVRFSFAEIDTPAGALHDIAASLTRKSPRRGAIAFYGLFEDGPFEGEGRFDWSEGSGELKMRSRLNPSTALATDTARDLGVRREISFEQAPYASARATVKNWRFINATARAHARQANIDGVAMDHASGTAQILPDRFIVPQMFLAYDDFQAEGAYEVEFDSKKYRLFFNGTVRPLHISTWFKDWWTKLWKEFEFPGDPLRGDVDIRSVHGAPEEVDLNGSVAADDFSIRGVPFESVRSKLFVRHKYADLFDIDLTRREGKAHGSFQYRGDRLTKGFGSVNFSARSTVNPVEVAAIFGDEGVELVSSFSFTEPPSLSLDGVVYQESRADQNHVKLTGQTAAPLEYDHLPLDSLSVEALIEGKEWHITEMTADFAGGNITGYASKRVEDEEEQLGFTLALRELDLERSFSGLKQWKAKADEEDATIPVGQKMKGIVDMNIDASGVYGDFESFIGDGRIEIREADLAEVHLLGVVSRALSLTPLGFTSLQFDEADAGFRLQRDRVHFHHLHLTGPTSAIRAAGHYLIDQEALDFSLRVYFLKESKIPLLSTLLSPLLEPLAHVTEIRLTGPVADPEWRFLLGARNIIREISSGNASDDGKSPPER